MSKDMRHLPVHSPSRPPSRLYSQSPTGTRTPITPSPITLHSSLSPLEISEVQFTSQEDCDENHTARLPSPGSDALLRRGNTLVLKVTTSADLSCRYCVSLTFVPVFRPRERFGQFRAKGTAKDSRELWLSITIPTNFPVGKYHAHVALSLGGGAEVLTHYHHKPIVVLFNPWDPGELVPGVL